MATLAQPISASPRPWAWFQGFLKEELAPRPGRGAMVARMVVASTLTMIISMTFRIPFGAYGAIYALTISRESTEATVKAVRTILLAFALAASTVFAGATLFFADPTLRLIWVIAILFLMFYALSALSNYTAAVRFGYLVVITIPLWDRHIPAELRVEGTLWAVAAIAVGSLITVAVELVFAELRPRDDLIEAIAQRLAAVEEVLAGLTAARPLDKEAVEDIAGLAIRGASRLRRNLGRSSYSPGYREQMGAVVALVGRLVDITANLMHLGFKASDDDRQRIRTLAENVSRLRADLLSGKTLRLAQSYGEGGTAPSGVPLLPEMEQTVAQVAEVFEGTQSLSGYARPASTDEPRSRLFRPDALSNPEHVKFGLRGCLAASLCYIIYTAVDHPEINTAITTCLLTGLTTIGSSRQKQVLRFAGALVGGAVGIGAQMFILPSLDSIGGFTLLFVAVTLAASWIATSSPRLSYFGVQVAVAFDLINLQEFKIQTSLAVARDRVLGILLGLAMMWLAFDQLWSAPAAVEMKRAFVATLRLLAQLTREPISKERRVAIERSYSLRDTINNTLDKVRALADAVLFEFGPSRQQDLALRDRIRRWGPELRMLFLTRIALLKYRLQLRGFELPEAIRQAQKEFDEQLAGTLDAMADRIEGKKETRIGESLADSIKRLENTTVDSRSELPGEALAAQLQAFLPLSRRMESLTSALDSEVRREFS